MGHLETATRPPATPGGVLPRPLPQRGGVIGSTLTHLLGNTEARVVIVDGTSDDRTADIVRYVGGDRTLLISRRLPEARQGKGLALNAGLPAIVTDARAQGLDQSDVLVCVMDADGYLSDGALPHVLRLFEDPRVGGAQLGVRISNRKVNLLTAMQDFEFWGLAATAQMGRVRLGTVSLGGNGQFTRLSALCELGDAPWSSALTEDLDLALRLMGNGWRLTTTPEASVDQQAILTLPALVRQRTRWFQGHMACIGHLRSMWGSPTMSNLALLEVSAYLLIPWVFILPWSILFHLGLWELLGRLASAPSATLGGNGLVIRAITVVAWYLLGFGPSLFGGYLYYRQDRSVGKGRAIVLGHELVLCNYVAFISCWLAAFRSLRGRRGWEKTVRRTEGGAEYLVPAAGRRGRARPGHGTAAGSGSRRCRRRRRRGPAAVAVGAATVGRGGIGRRRRRDRWSGVGVGAQCRSELPSGLRSGLRSGIRSGLRSGLPSRRWPRVGRGADGGSCWFGAIVGVGAGAAAIAVRGHAIGRCRKPSGGVPVRDARTSAGRGAPIGACGVLTGWHAGSPGPGGGWDFCVARTGPDFGLRPPDGDRPGHRLPRRGPGRAPPCGARHSPGAGVRRDAEDAA